MLELDVSVQRRHFAVTVALAVPRGERLGLLGPSGAGKTTVLEAIAGLVALSAGEVRLNGRLLSCGGRRPWALPAHQRRVGLLRQEPGLFPHLSVREHLAYGSPRGREASRWSPPLATNGTPGVSVDAPGRQRHLALALGIDEVLDSRPSALSGGQAQRVALGRLLASGFDVLLLDEPFSGLDAARRGELMGLVREEVARRQVPGVLVTHELTEAQVFADRLGVMDQGRLLQVGPPHAVVRAPASRRVAELVGYRAFLDAPGGRSFGVHPERVVMGQRPEEGVVVQGRVGAVRPSGPHFAVDVVVHDQPLVHCRLAAPLTPGEAAALTVVHPPWFGPDGLAVHADPLGVTGFGGVRGA